MRSVFSVVKGINMEYIYFILLIFLSIDGFYVGWRYVGRMENKRWITFASLSLAALILYSVFRFYPTLEYRLIPLWLSPLTEIIGWTPFATFFFGLAIKKVTTKFLPYEMAFIALMVFIFGIARVNWIFMDNGINPARFRINKDGVCLQSTGYSCGASSAVTFLRHFGIDATEKEMAYLSHTRYGLGVEMCPLAMAVAQKCHGKGLKVDLISTDWETLQKLNMPCIVDVKWNAIIDHVIVVLKTENNKVFIADPLAGRYKLTKEEFLDKWRGSAIVIK